ncbi:unnamed protein product [Timema podura]|uniref:Uncharacterized protein n=1 Tax=Timema podura TaxID=61482 RepID=A0ABN7P0R7_TIMPD|nr:unnamed protein product [Timema podura]
MQGADRRAPDCMPFGDTRNVTNMFQKIIIQPSGYFGWYSSSGEPKYWAAKIRCQISKPAPSQQVNYLNALGGSEETIHQSGSFKRLMNAVLGESEF